MKRSGLFLSAILLSALSTAPAWAGNYFLKRYVEQDAGLKRTNITRDSVTWVGDTTTDHTTYYTAYRHVCDTAVIGYTHENRCERRQVCHPFPRRVPGGPIETCTYRDYCGYVSVPVYGPVNCREEAYTASTSSDIHSPLVVEIVGAGVSGEQLADLIKEVHIGVRTNKHFDDVFYNSKRDRPRELNRFFDDGTLSQSDNSLLVMKAHGLRLRAKQDWLNLGGFQRGDTVRIRVQVEPAEIENKDKDVYSVLGTQVNFPEIHTSSWRR